MRFTAAWVDGSCCFQYKHAAPASESSAARGYADTGLAARSLARRACILLARAKLCLKQRNLKTRILD